MANRMKGGFGWLIVIIVVAAVAALGYWWYAKNGTAWSGTQSTTGASAPSTALPSGSSTSDAALTQDLSAMDAQIGAFNSDNAAVSSGLSDQQVSQAAL